MRVVVALIVALTVPVPGWQGPDGTATVRGRVVDAVTGRPLRVFIGFYPQPRLPCTPGIDRRDWRR
jgi:hypothetical protein